MVKHEPLNKFLIYSSLFERRSELLVGLNATPHATPHPDLQKEEMRTARWKAKKQDILPRAHLEAQDCVALHPDTTLRSVNEAEM